MGPNLVVAPISPDGDFTMKTSQVCPDCGEQIVFTEELVQLMIVQLHIVNGQVLLHPIMDEDNDFLYEPYYIQFSPCWEGIEEWLEGEIENVPPVEDDKSPFHCRYCKSGIREWEVCGSLTMGEFHISPRNPVPGVTVESFVQAGEPDLICSYCLFLINEGNTEFWDSESGGITDINGECGDCLQARCWRSQYVCNCPCHEQEEEDGC